MTHLTNKDRKFIRKVRQDALAETAPGMQPDALPPSQEHDRQKQLMNVLDWLHALYVQPENTDNMLYFIMYDIANNKVRKHVARYLERKGCIRVQKSIFVAQTPKRTYRQIDYALKKVNEKYKNGDSIFILPIAKTNLEALRVIGKNINFQVLTEEVKVLYIGD